jgi:hypothetical protein
LVTGPSKTRRTSLKQAGVLRASTDGRRCRPDIEVIDIIASRQGAFTVALENASSGAHILYHLGEYCAGPHRVDARVAYENGRVILTTRKRGNLQFEYIAIPLSKNQK